MVEDPCPGLECCVTLAGESATFLLSSLAYVLDPRKCLGCTYLSEC